MYVHVSPLHSVNFDTIFYLFKSYLFVTYLMSYGKEYQVSMAFLNKGEGILLSNFFVVWSNISFLDPENLVQ